MSTRSYTRTVSRPGRPFSTRVYNVTVRDNEPASYLVADADHKIIKTWYGRKRVRRDDPRYSGR